MGNRSTVLHCLFESLIKLPFSVFKRLLNTLSLSLFKNGFEPGNRSTRQYSNTGDWRCPTPMPFYHTTQSQVSRYHQSQRRDLCLNLRYHGPPRPLPLGHLHRRAALWSREHPSNPRRVRARRLPCGPCQIRHPTWQIEPLAREHFGRSFACVKSQWGETTATAPESWQ